MLIRTWTRSKYSHAGILLDGMMYEATAKHGVQKRTISTEELSRYWVVVPIQDEYVPKQGEEIKERLERHIGDRYDWWAIFFSRILPLDIQHRKQWYCFEYVAWALGMAKAYRWTGRTFEHFLSIARVQ